MTPAAAEVVTEQEQATSDLFVVSNVGQIRTAALVAQQSPEIVAPRLLVLWTTSNRQLLRTMLALAARAGLPATAVKIANAPNVPLPNRMRRMVGIIDAMPPMMWAPRLWLCNTNSFYGYIAHTYAASGASINLFEEGLGSYRSHLDPPFARDGVGARLRQLSISIRSIVTNRSLGNYRKVRRVAHHTARFLAETGPGRRVNSMLVAEAPSFIEPWSEFDRAVLAFPHLADPLLVRASLLERLDMEPERAEIAARERESGAVRIEEPLLLSQRYGVPYQPWAEAITAVLSARGITRVALKHHPREIDRERADLALALIRAGIEVRADPAYDAWTAEALILESGTEEVIGITSSTLVYRPYTPWPVAYTAIGREVLEVLKKDDRVHPGSLVHLEGDVRILERVLPRLDL